MRDQILESIHRALELPDGYLLSSDAIIHDVPGWDSVAWISVVVAIERIIKREFPMDHLDTIVTLGELLELVAPTKSI